VSEDGKSARHQAERFPPGLLRLLDAVSLAAFLTFLASALVLIVLWVVTLVRWLGWLGLPLGVVSAPLAAVFPFVYRAVEGTFPELGLRVWIVSLLGVAISLGWHQLRPRDEKSSGVSPDS